MQLDCRYELPHHEDALDDFDRALEQDPRSILALNGKAEVLTGSKRFGEAMATFDKAVAIDARSDQTFNRAGNLVFAKEDCV